MPLYGSGGGQPETVARYYDPTIARFISPDTIVPGVGDPQAWNRYAYVLGNPLRYTDPSGHCIVQGPNPNILFDVTDGDGDGVIDAFDCMPSQVYGFSWSLMQRWAAMVMGDESALGRSNVQGILDVMARHGRWGDLSLFGIRQYGQNPACVATGTRNFSCPAEPEPEPPCAYPICEIPGVTITVPDGTIPNGQAITFFPFNIIEESAPPCIHAHERHHNAQTVFRFQGNPLVFSAVWLGFQIIRGDPGNPYENQAERYSGCG